MKFSLSIVLLSLVAAAYSRPIENSEDKAADTAMQKRALPHLGPSPSSRALPTVQFRAFDAPTARALPHSIARRDAEATTEKLTEGAMNKLHEMKNSQIFTGFAQVGAGLKSAGSSAKHAAAKPFKAAGHMIAKPFVAAKDGVVGAAQGAEQGYQNAKSQ